MTKDLSQTWVIIAIGKREYAINSNYIQAFTELKLENLIREAKTKFIKGTYKLFNSDIIVLDGHKIAREESQTDRRMEFCKNISNIILKYDALIDKLEWIIETGERDRYYTAYKDTIIEWFNSQDFKYDRYLDKMFTKAYDHTMIIATRADKIIKERYSGKYIYSELTYILDDIKREYNRHVKDNLNHIIDYYTSKISDMCMIIKTGDSTFGLAIDSVKLVAEDGVKIRGTKRTVLSAGVANINNIDYNILDLTKIKNIIYQ